MPKEDLLISFRIDDISGTAPVPSVTCYNFSMSANLHLIVHDAVGILSALVITVLGFFVLLRNYKKTINITLGLTFLGAIVAIVANVIGVSVRDPDLSRFIMMWNVAIIFISVVNFHCVMAILDKDRKMRGLIIFLYVIGAVFMALFLVHPDTFIGVPVAKMYFPNYYTPGTLHWVFNLVFKLIIPAAFIWQLAAAAYKSADPIQKKHFGYFAISFFLGWCFGIVPTFLTYDIPVDPIWGMLFPIVFSLPFVYAIFKYELLNIRVVAKKAFMYAGTVVGVGVLIGFFNFGNQWVGTLYPDFPIWATPLILSIIIVAIGVLIWQQLRESEILKYEFITTVTHKFRTPLTHIKWAAENLKSASTPEERPEQFGIIDEATSKLVELTDLLANASESSDELYKYRIEKQDLSKFANEVVDAHMNHAGSKKLRVERHIENGVTALFDETRLRFVMQTFIENAINYSNEGGNILVKVFADGNQAVCSVTDNGIGIPKHELSLISTKLYRGERARVTDTEGMGIGLYISRGVVARHHGKLAVESDGEGKGSTFSFSLPLAR